MFQDQRDVLEIIVICTGSYL